MHILLYPQNTFKMNPDIFNINPFLKKGSPVRAWADLNKELDVFGKSLCTWCNPLAGFGAYLDLWKRMAATLADLDARSPSIMNIKELHAAAEEIIREDLRFTVLEQGYLGWSHPKARLDDAVYLLAGCSMPVVVRKHRDSHGMMVVGHAFIDGVMNGELWGEDERELEQVILY